MGKNILEEYNQPQKEEKWYYRQNILSLYNLSQKTENLYFQQNILSQYNLPKDSDNAHLQQNDRLIAYFYVANQVGTVVGANAARFGGWETMLEYSLPNGDLPILQQAVDDVGCTQAVIRSINEYFGGQPIADKDLAVDRGADFREMVTELHKNNKIKFSAHEFYRNIYLVGRELAKGHPSAVTYHQHTVGINRVVILINRDSNKQKPVIHVMDPLYSDYQILSEVDFYDGTVRLTIPD